MGLIGVAMAAMITLAAQASLAANVQVIRVLRLVGARDSYIARAFVRRFTVRAGLGAVIGVVLGVGALQMMPQESVDAGFATQFGFVGAGWIWPLVIPLLAAIVAFVATRWAALRRLKELT
jgi:cell division transport system permease protein